MYQKREYQPYQQNDDERIDIDYKKRRKSEGKGLLWFNEWSAWPPEYTLATTIHPKKTLLWATKYEYGGRFFALLVTLGLIGLIISAVFTGGLTLIPAILLGIAVAISGMTGFTGLLIGVASTILNFVAFAALNLIIKPLIYIPGFLITNIIRGPFKLAEAMADGLDRLLNNIDRFFSGNEPQKEYTPGPYRGFLWWKSWTVAPNSFKQFRSEYGLFKPWSFKGSFLWAMKKDNKRARALTWLITLGIIGVWIAAVAGFAAFSILTAGLGPLAIILITAAVVLLAPVIRVAVAAILGFTTFAINATIFLVGNIAKAIVSAICGAAVGLARLFARFVWPGKWPSWGKNRPEPDEYIKMENVDDNRDIVEMNQQQQNQYSNQSRVNVRNSQSAVKDKVIELGIASKKLASKVRNLDLNPNQKDYLTKREDLLKQIANIDGQFIDLFKNLVEAGNHQDALKILNGFQGKNGKFDHPLSQQAYNYIKQRVDIGKLTHQNVNVSRIDGKHFVELQTRMRQQQHLNLCKPDAYLINEYIKILKSQGNGEYAKLIYRKISDSSAPGLQDYVNTNIKIHASNPNSINNDINSQNYLDTEMAKFKIKPANSNKQGKPQWWVDKNINLINRFAEAERNNGYSHGQTREQIYNQMGSHAKRYIDYKRNFNEYYNKPKCPNPNINGQEWAAGFRQQEYRHNKEQQNQHKNHFQQNGQSFVGNMNNHNKPQQIIVTQEVDYNPAIPVQMSSYN